MRTVDEIRADILQYKKYEDVPKELRKEYNEISLQMIQQEENDIYRRYEITKDIPFDRLQEICQAECEGRCVVLPCKVGDTVYVISNEPCPYNCKHQYRNDGQFNIWHKENNNNCKQCEYIDKKYIWEREFYLNDLARVDKAVFLTKEEAEQALKGELK